MLDNNVIDINERKVRAYVSKNRPAEEMRDKIDLGYKYEKGIIEIFFKRPVWSKPNTYQDLSFAKIKYIKTQKSWKLFWMRASGKWQAYEPFHESSNLEELLNIIDEDAHGCFKG